MKKLVASAVAGALLLGSTAAVAETRPQATQFTKPVTAPEGNQDGEEPGIVLWLVAAGLSLALIGALLELLKAPEAGAQGNSSDSSGGNSPNRP